MSALPVAIKKITFVHWLQLLNLHLLPEQLLQAGMAEQEPEGQGERLSPLRLCPLWPGSVLAGQRHGRRALPSPARSCSAWAVRGDGWARRRLTGGRVGP